MFIPAFAGLSPSLFSRPLVEVLPRRSSICPHPISRRTPRAELVVVAGATGGVGRLVVQRLLALSTADDLVGPGINVTAVRALVRDSTRAKSILPIDHPSLSICPLSSIPSASNEQLVNAMTDAAALVICTGTTAFPTKAWRGGNTPTAVDDHGVAALLKALTKGIRRVVLVSSIGTTRTSQFPFVILNAFQILDAKARGEQHVRTMAKQLDYSYAIVRPGRLVGAPHTNVGMLKSEPKERMLDVAVAKGDSLVGELSRAAAADAVVFAITWDSNADLDFSVVHSKGVPPSSEKWKLLLDGVQTRR